MTQWRNRIVGEGVEDADQFLANEANWRIHNKAQQDALAGVLDDIGWIQKVIVNKRTDPTWGRDRNVKTLIDGHLRVSLAISKGEQVPVVYVDLTPEEERLALATIDPISAMAVTDPAKLDELMRGISTANAAVMEMLASVAEKSGLMPMSVDFPEYDESIASDVKYCECPNCGHKFPK